MQISIWEKESFYADKDVIIIGAGFSGLWSAYELLRNNKTLKVAILERGTIPTGASTRNAGFSCFGSPTELISDAAEIGEETMWELVNMRYQGLVKIRSHFTEEVLGYDPCGGYECLDKDSVEARACLEKLDWLNEGLQQITGQKTVFSWADDKLVKLGLTGFGHLIENPLEAALHSGLYVEALARLVQTMGAALLYGCEVEKTVPFANNVVVYTKSGLALKARKLLYCTNAFSPELLPGIEVTPARGQVLVTAPIPGLQLRGTFHYDEGFYYFRNLGNRILLGGARNLAIEEETTAETETTDLIQRHLEAFLARHITGGLTYDIEYRWAGIMGMGAGKLPLVKRLENNSYCSIRMGGMGVAIAPIAAEKVARLILEDL